MEELRLAAVEQQGKKSTPAKEGMDDALRRGTKEPCENAVSHIASRTRTKVSLVDTDIADLETFLDDGEGENISLGLMEDLSDYHRFIASTWPTTEEDHAQHFFDDDLDDKDEEYVPEDVAENEEDCDYSTVISPKELHELLWDSSVSCGTMDSLPLTNIYPAPANLTTSGGHTLSQRSINYVPLKPYRNDKITRLQCLQLASQLHKHLQLCLQSLAISSQMLEKGQTLPMTSANWISDFFRVRQMVLDLQFREQYVRQSKCRILEKLRLSNPGHVHVGKHGNEPCFPVSKRPKSNQHEAVSIDFFNRRVTRSLASAHTAIITPSMFEINGLQSMGQVLERFDKRIQQSENDSLHIASTYTNSDGEKSQKRTSPILDAKSLAILHPYDRTMDVHLKPVLPPKKKSKKPWTKNEDSLLALGVKNYRSNWNEIRLNLVPNKTIDAIMKRHRYLTSSKAPTNLAKEYHLRNPFRLSRHWLAEEDQLLVKGYMKLREENAKMIFSKISKNFLSHRSRGDSRKRWNRIRHRFENKQGNLDTAKIKQFLDQDLSIARKSNIHKASTNKETKTTHISNRGPVSKDCAFNNLHPGLFYTEWGLLEPKLLFRNSCRHSWPYMPKEFDISLKESTVSPPTKNDFFQRDYTLCSALDEAVLNASDDSSFEEVDLESDEDDEIESIATEVERTQGDEADIRMASDAPFVEEMEHHDFDCEELSSSDENEDLSDDPSSSECADDHDIDDVSVQVDEPPSSTTSQINSSLLTPQAATGENICPPNLLKWTKSEDRAILVAAKTMGASIETWNIVHSSIPLNAKTCEQIGARYQYLIELLKQKILPASAPSQALSMPK